MEIKNTLKVGLKKKLEHTVAKEDLASAIGSGAIDVFSTPRMISLMEAVSLYLADEHLEEGYSTVGTLVNIKHTAATPLGMKVTAKCEILEIDRKKLVYKVECYDEKEKIGEGLHERFIINKKSFIKRAAEKSKN